MMELKGKLGKTIFVDSNFIEFRQKSLLLGTTEKKIPISQVSSVEVKKPGFSTGYLQISEIGTNKNKGLSSGAMQAVEDENSLLFNSKEKYNMALDIKAFIEKQMLKSRTGQTFAPEPSAADEIVKYKSLLDQGIISQEEFNAKKKQLLGL